jgi:hypothetical protein
MLSEYLRVIGIWKSGNCPLTPFPSNPQLGKMTPCRYKIWNSRTQEKEAGKGGYRTNEESTAENPRLRNTGSVIDRQVSGRREPPEDWRAGMPLKPA